MAIKLKNKFVTATAWLAAFCSLSIALLSAEDIWVHRSYLNSQYYFSSYSFYQELQRNLNLITYMHIDNRDYPQLTDEAKIGQDRIEAWTQEYRYRNMMNADIPKLLEERKTQYLTYKNREYNEVADSLAARNGTFSYSITDQKNNLIYSNTGTDEEQKQALSDALYAVHLPQASVNNPYLQSINDYFQQHQLKGELIVPGSYKDFSQIHVDYRYYHSIKERLFKELGLAIVAAAAAVSLFRSLTRSQRWNHEQAKRGDQLLKRMPIDIRYGVTLIVAMYAIHSFGSRTDMVFHLPLGWGQLAVILWLAVQLAFLLLAVKDIHEVSKRQDGFKEEWKMSYMYKLRTLLGHSLTNKRITAKVGVLFVLTALLGISFFVFLYASATPSEHGLAFGAMLYMALYFLTVGPYVLRRIDTMQRILAGAGQMAGGNLAVSIEGVGTGYLHHLAGHMNNMKIGYQRTLEERMKSERLKSELITNVSHDLKTPLTSILNYVDLLKREGSTPEEISSYIEVLDKKTQRLKGLVDDLFEASKMASGNVELQVELVNVAALLEQALAEFDDRLAEKSLTVRTDITSSKLQARLDGKKTWRVFENLIGNAVKYALPSTRIHISLKESERHVIFTIKNVSAYEIDYDPEELFERFKRGDSSRHTEGSGLGLAIAKSIVELQGGTLRIEIDGDYFKAIVQLPM